jgi:hypothetical protein
MLYNLQWFEFFIILYLIAAHNVWLLHVPFAFMKFDSVIKLETYFTCCRALLWNIHLKVHNFRLHIAVYYNVEEIWPQE